MENQDFKWHVDEEKTAEHMLTLNDDEGFFIATVRFDGTVDITSYNPGYLDLNGNKREINENQDCIESIRIWDVDKTISQLIAIKNAAKKHFGDEWD